MTTMDQQLLDDVRRISEQQAVQNQMLQQIMQQLQTNAQASAQQSAQLSALSGEMLVIKNENAKYQSEINSLNTWKNDTFNLFIPRREYEELKERVKNVETWQREIGEKQGESRMNLFQWIVSNGISVLIFLIGIILAIYSYISK